MQQFSQQQREYIFEAVDDRGRLLALHRSLRPWFLASIERIMDEYGLAKRLEAAKTAGQPLQILEIGCGEGLYLYDLAGELERRDLLAGAVLNGLDINKVAIATAQDFARLAKPARPYLRFFPHDINRPLTENPYLRSRGYFQFDFVFAWLTLPYIPQARQVLERIYMEELKSGGLVYLHDLQMLPDEAERWLLHPAMRENNEFYVKAITGINGGISVPNEEAGWLKETGATMLEDKLELLQASARNNEELAMLRNMLFLYNGVSQQRVRLGLLTQAAMEQTRDQIYRELNRDSKALLTYTNVVARKPE